MNRNTLITIIIVVIVVIAGVAVYAGTHATPPASETQNASASIPMASDMPGMEASSTAAASVGATVNVGASTGAEVQAFTITGSNFAFSPKQISVKKGDTVKITFVNSNGFHDFRIDQFNVVAKPISGGQQETITFVADKTGSFEYYCAIGNHRAMGMWGTLTVTE